ncbi:hypothetical protein ABPG75_010313 [Micractinium tetrahymenae]
MQCCVARKCCSCPWAQARAAVPALSMVPFASPMQVSFYSTPAGTGAVNTFYEVLNNQIETSGTPAALQHKARITFVDRTTGQPVFLPYVSLTLSDFDASSSPGLHERFYAMKDSLVGIAIGENSPLRLVSVTYQGRDFVGAYTTVSDRGQMQVTYKNVSYIDIMALRDKDGGQYVLDFSAPFLPTNDGNITCITPS